MKKALLLSATVLCGMSAMAQTTTAVTTINPKKGPYEVTTGPVISGMVTAEGDTSFVYQHVKGTDTITYYTYNVGAKGYPTGCNSLNHNGYAEVYTFFGTDSTVKILGTLSAWTGHVSSTSIMTLDLKVWGLGPSFLKSTKLYYTGLPVGPLLAQETKFWSALTLSTTALNHNLIWFTTPTPYIGDTAVFVGYDMLSYTYGSSAPGDSIALLSTSFTSSTPGVGKTRYYSKPTYSTTTLDTTVINQNVYHMGGSTTGTWHDLLWEGPHLVTNLLIAPVFKVHYTGMPAVKKNDLTLYGNYPNPAATTTNIKYALNTATDVTISIMDVLGKVVNTMELSNQSAGEHIQPINLSNLAPGNYVYHIITAEGGKMAAQFTVAK